MLFDRQEALTGTVAQRDREIGELRSIQQALVPHELPDRPALDLASCYVPADHGVGGDFYLVGEGPGESTVVVIGDVVGKGLEAARRAAFVRAALATYVPFTDDACRLLQLANRSLVDRVGVSEQFVTAACVTLRPEEGELTWAVAGHPPPMLLDHGRRLNGVRPAPPLGIEPEIACEPGHQALGPGAGLLLYTDGLVEARRPWGDEAPRAGRAREQFGAFRVAEILDRRRGEQARTVVRALRAAAEDFAGGELDDDLCILAVRLRQTGG